MVILAPSFEYSAIFHLPGDTAGPFKYTKGNYGRGPFEKKTAEAGTEGGEERNQCIDNADVFLELEAFHTTRPAGGRSDMSTHIDNTDVRSSGKDRYTLYYYSLSLEEKGGKRKPRQTGIEEGD